MLTQLTLYELLDAQRLRANTNFINPYRWAVQASPAGNPKQVNAFVQDLGAFAQQSPKVVTI